MLAPYIRRGKDSDFQFIKLRFILGSAMCNLIRNFILFNFMSISGINYKPEFDIWLTKGQNRHIKEIKCRINLADVHCSVEISWSQITFDNLH